MKRSSFAQMVMDSKKNKNSDGNRECTNEQEDRFENSSHSRRPGEVKHKQDIADNNDR